MENVLEKLESIKTNTDNSDKTASDTCDWFCSGSCSVCDCGRCEYCDCDYPNSRSYVDVLDKVYHDLIKEK